MRILPLLLLLLFGGLGCVAEQSKPFEPVVRSGDALVVQDDLNTAEFRANLSQVLAHYGVRHRVTEEAIFVPTSVNSDRDTAWNYTNKARDEAWSAGHR